MTGDRGVRVFDANGLVDIRDALKFVAGSGAIVSAVTDPQTGQIVITIESSGGGGGGAPTGATYLTATADATLTNEVVVGTTPGGELGNTWASPTVDATHAGSSHAAAQAAAEATAAAADAAHVAAGDPHPAYITDLELARHGHMMAFDGEDGVPGPPGPPGAAGPAGAPGAVLINADGGDPSSTYGGISPIDAGVP